MMSLSSTTQQCMLVLHGKPVKMKKLTKKCRRALEDIKELIPNIEEELKKMEQPDPIPVERVKASQKQSIKESESDDEASDITDDIELWPDSKHVFDILSRVGGDIPRVKYTATRLIEAIEKLKFVTSPLKKNYFFRLLRKLVDGVTDCYISAEQWIIKLRQNYASRLLNI